MTALDRSSAAPWERRFTALPPWLAFLWLLSLGGLAVFRDPNKPGPTWPQELWALAWAWVLFGGLLLIIVFVGIWVLWFSVRLVFLALAVVLSVVLIVGRGIDTLRAHAA